MNWQFYLYLVVMMQVLAGVFYLTGVIPDFSSSVLVGLLLFVFYGVGAVVRDVIQRRW
jgi:uncharacterized membrane protein YphA (DoxX/SURF4 family)